MEENKPESDEFELVTLICLWDEALGPTITAQVPEMAAMGDTDMIAVQIFMTFQTVFGESSEVAFNRTFLTIPFKSYHRTARILLETVVNPEVREGLQPYIVVLFLPDYLPEEKISLFDPILSKIGVQFKNKVENPILAYSDELKETLIQAEQMDDLEITLEPSYSLTHAVEDFKKGIGNFQAKKWDGAYPLLRKALEKFNRDNQPQLSLEATYLISTILLQLKKYRASIKYFESLNDLAKGANHQKYLEISTFMLGFANNKLNQITEAISWLEKIDIETTQFVNKLQYFSIMGRLYSRNDLYDKAESCLKEALSQSKVMKESTGLKRQQAQILYDIGYQIHRQAVLEIKTKGFEQQSNETTKNLMLSAIDYFSQSAVLWDNLNEYKNFVHTYHHIGGIYGYLLDVEKQLESFMKALTVAEKLNEIIIKLQIIDEILFINTRLEKYETNITLLQSLLDGIKDMTLIDIFSIAGIHFKIGKNFDKLGQTEESIKNLLLALNGYKRSKVPTQEQLSIVDMLIEIYEKKGETDKIEYYSQQRDELKVKFKKPIQKGKSSIGILKDIWAYTKTGMEIFGYAPEMKFDSELFGGFLTALQSLSVEISDSTLDAIVIGNSRYNIYREENAEFFLLSRSLTKDNEQTVKATLKILYTRFQKEYGEHLVDFRGNIGPFSTFQDIMFNMDLDIVD
jgi:tetratricopeptide (TPR) repeat protein